MCRLKLCLQTYSIPKTLKKQVATFLPADIRKSLLAEDDEQDVLVKKRKYRDRAKQEHEENGKSTYSGSTDLDEGEDVILQKLPHGWLKKIVWKYNSEKHWDVFLVSPNGKKFSSRSEVMAYVEEAKIPYCDSYHNFLVPSYLDRMVFHQEVEDGCFNGMLKDYSRFKRMRKDLRKEVNANESTVRHTKIRAAQRLKKRATKQYVKIRGKQIFLS